MDGFIRNIKWYHFGILGLVFFVPFLGYVHLFDWDEINFAESAREMLLTGKFLQVQINFSPFWEKPPFFIWLQASCMSLFGVSEFAARLPNALTGIITLCLLFILGNKMLDRLFGTIWALSYLGSVLPHLYFKSGIIDPVFNLFIFLSLVFAWRALSADTDSGFKLKSVYWLLLAGIFSGIAVWTKGPVGFFIPFLVLLAYQIRIKLGFKELFHSLLYFSSTAGLLSVLWLMATINESGLGTFYQFVSYMWRLAITEDAGHGGPFYYHAIVLLIGCFPLSVFSLPYLCSRDSDRNWSGNESLGVFFKLMWLLFWIVLLVFSIVQTKIIHYSSLCYFPMSYMAAAWLYRWIQGKHIWRKWMTLTTMIMGVSLGLILTIIPVFGIWSNVLGPMVKDKFISACLSSSVDWLGFEWLLGLIYILTLILLIPIKEKGRIQFVSGLFLSTAFLLFLYLPLVVPKIENYTQRPAIEFCKSFAGKDVYIQTVGFKSYIHYFYTNKTRPDNQDALKADWLLNGQIDKTTYFISRVDRNGDLKQRVGIDSLYQSGGFVFYKRESFK